MPLFHPANDTEWHRLRHRDVTSTEASALFGLSPYSTAYELAVQKIEEHPPTFGDNAAISASSPPIWRAASESSSEATSSIGCWSFSR